MDILVLAINQLAPLEATAALIHLMRTDPITYCSSTEVIIAQSCPPLPISRVAPAVRAALYNTSKVGCAARRAIFPVGFSPKVSFLLRDVEM